MGLGEVPRPSFHGVGAGTEQVAALVGALDALDYMSEAGFRDLAGYCGVGAPASEASSGSSGVVIWEPDCQHVAVSDDIEGTIGCACDGPISDDSEGKGPRFYGLSPSDGPITCVRSGAVIWSPEQPSRETEAERAATAETRLTQFPYEHLGPAGRTLGDDPRDGRRGGLGL